MTVIAKHHKDVGEIPLVVQNASTESVVILVMKLQSFGISAVLAFVPLFEDLFSESEPIRALEEFVIIEGFI